MANSLAESLTTARMTLGWIAGASACSSCSEGYFAGEAGGHLSMLIDGGRTRIFRVYMASRLCGFALNDVEFSYQCFYQPGRQQALTLFVELWGQGRAPAHHADVAW